MRFPGGARRLGAGPGPGQIELVLGPGESNVAEPALFLEPTRLFLRAGEREETVLQSGQDDHRPLQALGGMQRHEGDALLLAQHLIGRREQCGLRQKPLQRRSGLVILGALPRTSWRRWPPAPGHFPSGRRLPGPSASSTFS